MQYVVRLSGVSINSGSGKATSTLFKDVTVSAVALGGLNGTVITSSFLTDLNEAVVDGFFSGATAGSNFSLNFLFHETQVATAIELLTAAFAGARSPDEKNLRTFFAGGSELSEVAAGTEIARLLSDSGITTAFFSEAAEEALRVETERCCRDGFDLAVFDESEALRFRLPVGCVFLPALSRRFGELFFAERLFEV